MLRQLFSGGFGLNDIFYLILRLVMVLFAISVHELAHGYAAYKLGDSTAKLDGRLSLNPLRHLDPLGALCMFCFGFGWAKPVMINPTRFKNLKRDTALTSLAGPVSNILLAYVATVIGINVGVRLLQSPDIWSICMTFASLNIGLAIFNLIPIPPLDGSKIFLSLLPKRIYYEIMRYERFGFIILAIALYLNVLDPILIRLQTWLFQLLFWLAGGGLL